MRTFLDCYPCFLKQALEAARLAGADPKTQKEVADAIAGYLPEVPLSSSPPETGRIVYGLVRRMTGSADPYRDIKRKSNRLAAGVYDLLKRRVARSSDRLLSAVELAIAGNIIDYGARNALNIEDELAKIVREEAQALRHERRSVFDFPGFRAAVKKAKTILYLADNAGETVFDRVLIEEIVRSGSKRIVYAVKEKPVINDALAEDAAASGIDTVAEIVSSGADAPGTVLKYCSTAFRKRFREAEMVISKGQGNFEALSDVRREVFFLLMAKCPVIARHVSALGTPCSVGDVILYHGKQQLPASASRRRQ